MELELKHFKSQNEMENILKELTQTEFCKEYIKSIKRIDTQEVLEFFETYTIPALASTSGVVPE